MVTRRSCTSWSLHHLRFGFLYHSFVIGGQIGVMLPPLAPTLTVMKQRQYFGNNVLSGFTVSDHFTPQFVSVSVLIAPSCCWYIKLPKKKQSEFCRQKKQKNKINNVNFSFAHSTKTHLSCSTAAAVYAWMGLNMTESSNERHTSNVHTPLCMHTVDCTTDKFHVGKQSWQTQSWSRRDTQRVRQLGWQKQPDTQYTHTQTHNTHAYTLSRKWWIMSHLWPKSDTHSHTRFISISHIQRFLRHYRYEIFIVFGERDKKICLHNIVSHQTRDSRKIHLL